MTGPTFELDLEADVFEASGALVDDDPIVEAVTESETLPVVDTVSFFVVEAHFVKVLLFVAARSVTIVSLEYTLGVHERQDSWKRALKLTRTCT